MDVELVKMSPKGQLVVSQDIRVEEGFSPGDRFVQFPVKEGVLFKKVKIPKVKLEWRQLAKEVQQKFKEKGVKKSDVDGAIKWARKG